MAVIQEAYVHGVSTRAVDDLVQAMVGSGVSKSQVSCLCAELDERVGAFLTRPIEGEWPYLWLDARHIPAVSRPLHEERPGPCGQKPPPSRLGRWTYTPTGAAFAEADAEGARRQGRTAADQLRPKVPKLAALMDPAEEGVLAFMAFPKEHRAKIHSTNPLERVNGEIKQRTDVVGIFPNKAAVVRLVGAILLGQNDEWAVQRRYMSLETLAPISNNPAVSLPAVTA